MRIEDLSVNERILVHLKDFSGDPGNGDAAIGQTQEGIAAAIGIRINHVPRATTSLIREGYVGSALVHIGGLKRRRKAFFLTSKGAEAASRLISDLKGQRVTFRNSDGKERALSVQEIVLRMRGTTASRVMLAAFRDGMVLEASQQAAGPSHVSVLDTIPGPENFVNRVMELGRIRDVLGKGRNLLVVSGMKGIGKTSLVRQSLHEQEGRRNIFWYTLHEWDTPRSIMEHVSDQLVRIGRNEAKRTLRQFRDVEVGQGVSALARDLKDSESVLVLDNVFAMKRESLHFICQLAEESANLGDSALILITRDRESLEAAQNLRTAGPADLVVKGLESKGAMELMEGMGMNSEDSVRVFAMTQGHPLAIRLVNSDEMKELIDTRGLTKEEMWVVRCMKAFDAIFG